MINMKDKHIRKIARLVKRAIYLPYRASILWHLAHKRKIHVYCVGTARSGTTSIAGLFRKHYRTAHQPEMKQLISVIIEAANGSIDENEYLEFVKKRDKRLWLEADSSALNYFIIDFLVKEFKNAKFILTIRDPYTWLESFINHSLNIPDSGFETFRRLRFRDSKLEYSKEEKILGENKLFTFDDYLSNFWALQNKKILKAVPKNRLLVIRSHEITSNIKKIADFLDISIDTLSPENSHLNKAKKRYEILSKIDKDCLEYKVNLHCKDLMHEFFPEIKCISDVLQ